MTIYEETINHKITVRQKDVVRDNLTTVNDYLIFKTSLTCVSSNPPFNVCISRHFGLYRNIQQTNAFENKIQVTPNTGSGEVRTTVWTRQAGPMKLFHFGLGGVVQNCGMIDTFVPNFFPYRNMYWPQGRTEFDCNPVETGNIDNTASTGFHFDHGSLKPDGEIFSFPSFGGSQTVTGGSGYIFGTEHRIPANMMENYLSVVDSISKDSKFDSLTDYEPFKIYYGLGEDQYDIIELTRLRKPIDIIINPTYIITSQIHKKPDEFNLYGYPHAFIKLLPQLIKKLNFYVHTLGVTDIKKTRYFYMPTQGTDTPSLQTWQISGGLVGGTDLPYEHKFSGSSDLIIEETNPLPTVVYEKLKFREEYTNSLTKYTEHRRILRNYKTRKKIPYDHHPTPEELLDSGKLSMSSFLNYVPSGNASYGNQTLQWIYNHVRISDATGVYGSPQSGGTSPYTLSVGNAVGPTPFNGTVGTGKMTYTKGLSLRAITGARLVGPTRLKVINATGSGISGIRVVGYTNSTPPTPATSMTEDSNNRYLVGSVIDLTTATAMNGALMGGTVLGSGGFGTGYITCDDAAIDTFLDTPCQWAGVGVTIDYSDPGDGNSGSIEFGPDDYADLTGAQGISVINLFNHLDFGFIKFCTPCYGLI